MATILVNKFFHEMNGSVNTSLTESFIHESSSSNPKDTLEEISKIIDGWVRLAYKGDEDSDLVYHDIEKNTKIRKLFMNLLGADSVDIQTGGKLYKMDTNAIFVPVFKYKYIKPSSRMSMPNKNNSGLQQWINKVETVLAADRIDTSKYLVVTKDSIRFNPKNIKVHCDIVLDTYIFENERYDMKQQMGFFLEELAKAYIQFIYQIKPNSLNIEAHQIISELAEEFAYLYGYRSKPKASNYTPVENIMSERQKNALAVLKVPQYAQDDIRNKKIINKMIDYHKREGSKNFKDFSIFKGLKNYMIAGGLMANPYNDYIAYGDQESIPKYYQVK